MYFVGEVQKDSLKHPMGCRASWQGVGVRQAELTPLFSPLSQAHEGAAGHARAQVRCMTVGCWDGKTATSPPDERRVVGGQHQCHIVSVLMN